MVRENTENFTSVSLTYIKYIDYVWLTITCHWITKSPNALNIGLSEKRLKVDVSFQPAAYFTQ